MTKITAHLPSAATAGAAGSELPTISVSRHAREVLPQVGNVILCRVTRITPRQAVVAILVCGETVLEAEWQGVIRVQDVRATEKDRCKVYESFRPGDIVRASVVSYPSCRGRAYAPLCALGLKSQGLALERLIMCFLEQISLGDQSNYYLSTASNEYGVIMAVSEAGNVMYPVSWKEYKDPETGLSEARKVAKPY